MHLIAGSERECVHTLVGLVKVNFCHCCVFACIIIMFTGVQSLDCEYDKIMHLDCRL